MLALWRDREHHLRDLRRYLNASYIDLRLALTGKADPELPPLRLRDVGAGDFRATGDYLVRLLIEKGLQPNHHVLDVGSGIGRVAIPLTRYLTEGRYEGFDIVKRWVRWCRRNITPSHPNFRFTYGNVYNSHYNRRGRPAATFRFPYPDNTFDFVFATSVFTHLDPAGAHHYLDEIARVLRSSGTFVATFFITTGAAGETGMRFVVDRGDYRLLDENDPDAAIAFSERWLEAEMKPSVWDHYVITPGGWRSVDAHPFQDLVVAKKC